MWKKQESFYLKAIELANERKKSFSSGTVPNKKSEPEKYAQYILASENYHEHLIGVRVSRTDDINNYAFKSKGEYYRFKAIESIIFKIQTNPDKYLPLFEKDFKEQISAKLKQALVKKQIDLIDESSVKDTIIRESSKGYTISAIINDKLFVTECIGAGGYNIQQFHYRYIVKY